jgi:hypothetical protein
MQMAQVLDFAAFRKAQDSKKPSGPVLFLKPIAKKAQKRADRALSVRMAAKERL